MMSIQTEGGAACIMIEGRFRRRRRAEIGLCMLEFGIDPGAQLFSATTGTDMAAVDSVDRLACVDGFAPVQHYSAPISGNLKRPRGYS
jgi:hypothetical protein